MATGDVKTILGKMFSKGFLNDKGKNKTPDFFADDLWNIRIKNSGITIRNGISLIFDGANVNPVRGIVSNNSNRLYVTQNSHLREINYTLSPVTQTDLGSIATDNRCRFITYGIYTIILTGAGFPWVYDGTTLTQLSGTHITAGVNPQFGTRFAGFTVINSQLNPNIIYISRPITLANQTYAYTWLGTGAETITFDSPVLGLIGTLNNLWVFTEKTIERMGKDNLTTAGGVASLYTIPLTGGYQLASPDSVVAAGDYIFFMTKNKKFGNINYKATVAEPQANIFSDDPGNSIDYWTQTYLADDQSASFAIYDRKNNLVKRALKSVGSTTNDILLIRDIANETWLKDDNKYYANGCIMADEIYVGSALSYKVSQDEIEESDYGQGIEWVFETTDIVVDGNPTQEHQFRGASIAGQINNLCTIRRQILVDEVLVSDKTIRGLDIVGNIVDMGIGGSDIGGEPIGGEFPGEVIGLVDFERVITSGGLRYAGKKIKMIFSGGEIGQDFVLDYLDIISRQRKRNMIGDILG